MCPCGDVDRSPPSGSQESPIDLDGGNLGPTLMFEVSIQSRLVPPVVSCTNYEDHVSLYDRTKATTQKPIVSRGHSMSIKENSSLHILNVTYIGI